VLERRIHEKGVRTGRRGRSIVWCDCPIGAVCSRIVSVSPSRPGHSSFEVHPTMIDPATLDHAIAAHAKWKFRLREAIRTGQSEWTVEKVRPDDQCEFGKWLNSLPLPDRMMNEWKDVKALHAKFHVDVDACGSSFFNCAFLPPVVARFISCRDLCPGWPGRRRGRCEAGRGRGRAIACETPARGRATRRPTG